jgi:predicted AAA+ superfamily ATPase
LPLVISRHITPSLLEALSDTPVVFLNGARQTGKSFLARWLAATAHPARYLTLDEVAVLAAAQSDPTGFIAGLDGPVVLDEVQRVPKLFLAIKAQVDRDRRPGRFLLTGSADVLLLPELADSLAGRMEVLTLHPLSQGEIEGRPEGFIGAVFAAQLPGLTAGSESGPALCDRIRIGGYPEMQTRTLPRRRAAWFSSYLNTILSRDLRDLARIEGLAALPRLLSLLAARATSLLNFAELSRTAGLPQTTLKRYLSLLETAFLVSYLPAWSSNLGKRLVKAPKLMLNDTGLLVHLLGMDLSPGPQLGPVLENFVAAELRKQAAWSSPPVRLFHFRTQTGREVDLVLEDRAGRVVGIEVKATATPGAEDFKGLRALAEELGERFHRGIVLYTGAEDIPFGADLCALPVESVWRLPANSQPA